MIRKPLLLLVPLILFILLLNSCEQTKKRSQADPAFKAYIAGYTTGLLKRDASIIIRLATPNEQSKPGQEIDTELFQFEPAIAGKAQWMDAQTIVFKPNAWLPSNQAFEGSFALGLLDSVPENLASFPFRFQTKRQHMNVQVEGLYPYKNQAANYRYLDFKVNTEDVVDSAALLQTLSAELLGQEQTIRIVRFSGKQATFRIDSLERKKTSSNLILEWNGAPIAANTEAQRIIEIPAIDAFKVINLRVNHTPDQFLEIQFSDQLDAQQDLQGLVSLTGINNSEYFRNLSLNIDNNTIKVFLPQRLFGPYSVTLSQGIKSSNGNKLAVIQTDTVHFAELRPSLRLVSSGTILPSSQGLRMPFETVNLNAVEVRVLRIYEDNILPFFQMPTYNHGYRLNTIADEVLRTTIPLKINDPTQRKNWSRHFLDLSELIEVDPGAIYNVSLRFDHSHSTYPCEDVGATDEEQLFFFDREEEKPWSEDSWNDSYYTGYHNNNAYYNEFHEDYYNSYGYSDSPVNNPCRKSYYYQDVSVSTNILASDIGLIVKAGSDKQLHVFVTDLLTTEPIPHAEVEFYSFSQQKMALIKTDKQGMGEIRLAEKPFLAVAKHNGQASYVSLKDAEGLGMSKFSVGGSNVQDGIKGFIYTERGIWRPGDSIYLAFMLEDAQNRLPQNHPIHFELTDPRGVSVYKTVVSKNLNGLYDFRFATEPDAPTGNWLAEIQVGNKEFFEWLKVETVKPNRLKIYLDFEQDLLTAADEDPSAQLKAKWLHGAVAKNLKARVEVTVNQVATNFAGYEGYLFEDPVRDFYAEAETVFDGALNEKGIADVQAQLSVGQSAPGMLRAYFSTRVFEEGGSSSIDRFSIPYSPYEHYVGLKLPESELSWDALACDKLHKIKVVTVDAYGKAVSRKNLEVSVYQLGWRWWWDSYEEDLASFIGRNSSDRILTQTLSTNSAGEASFPLQIDRPNYGRFLIHIQDPESGHSTGKVVYFDWSNRSRQDQPATEYPTMLTFSTDKKQYDLGETVNLSFPSAAGSRALICLESGSKVLQKHWVETTSGETSFAFQTDERMAPNVYLHVSLLQPHRLETNDRPMRMYGVIPIKVENPETHLQPQLEMADVIRPSTSVPITVSEATGKPMTYTLALVDEGLLDLTRFLTPDPWSEFYGKEALGVKTWDLFDDVIGAYAASMDQILAVGGDGSGENDARKSKANRFKPMVRFVGPFALDANAKVTHQVEIPNYIGSVRVMLVAGQDQAYGNTQKTVAVRKPLMALATLPRVIGPGETVKLPVNVFALEKLQGMVAVEVETNSLFTVKGNRRRTLSFAEPGDQVVDFELEVADRIGVGTVKVIAYSGKEHATHEIEIDVRAANPEVTDLKSFVVEAGKPLEIPYHNRGISGTNQLSIELSAMPNIDLERRLKYLIRYPYGCIEQTTSSAFPQLFLSDILDLPQSRQHAIKGNIERAIRRISRFQLHEGAFSYWPGGWDQSPNEWGTNYAGHFLLKAEKRGYHLPSGLKDNWLKYQQQAAQSWNRYSYDHYWHYGGDLIQAYRLYTLALAGEPEMGAMNRLREDGELSDAGTWRLAATYALAGQVEIAQQMTANLPTSISKYTELGYGFGSAVRDEAMILEALVLMGHFQKAAPVAQKIASALSEQQWMSTQTTAFALLAMCQFVGEKAGDRKLHFSYALDGQQAVSELVNAQIQVVTYSESQLQKKGTITLKNQGERRLYARLIQTGIPITGDQSSTENHVSLQVNYTDMRGNPIDPSRIEQGTDFLAVVEVNNPGTYGNLQRMSLDQIFPSGWEIHNNRLAGYNAAYSSSSLNYQDIRDDRVYSFYELSAHQNKTFRIQLSATFIGRFYLPTVATSAMYNHEIASRVPGQWVEVVEPGE